MVDSLVANGSDVEEVHNVAQIIFVEGPDNAFREVQFKAPQTVQVIPLRNDIVVKYGSVGGHDPSPEHLSIGQRGSRYTDISAISIKTDTQTSSNRFQAMLLIFRT